MQVDRIREAHVERGGQPQLLADAYREHAAVHEYRAASGARRRFDYGFGARVLRSE